MKSAVRAQRYIDFFFDFAGTSKVQGFAHAHDMSFCMVSLLSFGPPIVIMPDSAAKLVPMPVGPRNVDIS